MRLNAFTSQKKKNIDTPNFMGYFYDTLIKSVSINSSPRTKVMCAISNNKLYNNNTRDIKIRESKNSSNASCAKIALDRT